MVCDLPGTDRGTTEGWWGFDVQPVHILWAVSPAEAGGEAGGITQRTQGLRDARGLTVLTALGAVLAPGSPSLPLVPLLPLDLANLLNKR